MTAREALGRNVKVARTMRGWDQPTLAEAMTRLGYAWSTSTVSRVEKADRGTSTDELMALALVLGYFLPDLLTPPEGESLALGNYRLRQGFVHDWARGAIVMWQTFDEEGKALPPRIMGPRQLPVLSYDTRATAIMRELDQ